MTSKITQIVRTFIIAYAVIIAVIVTSVFADDDAVGDVVVVVPDSADAVVLDTSSQPSSLSATSSPLTSPPSPTSQTSSPSTSSSSSSPTPQTSSPLTSSPPTTSPYHHNIKILGVLDNREFGSNDVSKTYFYIQPAVEFGVRVYDRHYIYGGAAFLQNFGAAQSVENLRALAYYHYDGRDLQFRFGAFPRLNAVDAPAWFIGDDAVYYLPYHMHGAAVGAAAGSFFGSAWIDWRGWRSAVVNEAFLFGYGVKFTRGVLTLRHDFVMHHHAHTDPPTVGEHLQDNGGMSAEAAASFGRGRLRGYADTLSLSAGGVVGLDRDRGDGIWHTPLGGMFGAYAGRGILAARLTAYFGEAQNLRHTGTLFTHLGARSYGRLDVIARFVRRENVSAEFYPSFHVADGEIGYSQHFLIRAEFGSDKVD